MKKFAILFVSVGFLFLFASQCLAGKTFMYPSVNPALKITFPDDWSVREDPDADVGIIVNSPDDEIEIDLWVLDEKDLKRNAERAMDDAAREVAGLIVYWVDDFKSGKTEEFTLNGIEFCEVTGTAKDKEDGSPVKVSVDFFSPDDKNVFVMMYWGSEDAETEHAAELKSIAKSIRKP